MKNVKTAKNKLKIGYIIKDLLLLLLVVTAYAFSVYVNGFSYTNYKLLNLLIYCVVGFVGAIIIYYIVYVVVAVISRVKEKKRNKMFSNFIPIECSGNYFKYDGSKAFKENAKEYISAIVETLQNSAKTCGYNGKYSYLNFTFEDAHSFVTKVVVEFEEKIDHILTFKLLNKYDLQNKPITILENTLRSVLEEEKKPKIIKEKKPSFISNLLGKAINKSVDFIFNNFIDNKLNSVINYVGNEATLIYAKNNYKYINKRYKKVKEEKSLEVAND